MVCQATVGGMPSRCVQLEAREKDWVLDRLRALMKKNHAAAAPSLRLLVGSKADMLRMRNAARKARASGISAEKVAAWLAQCSSEVAELETNGEDAKASGYCVSKYRTLLRRSRGRIGAAVYPEGESARVGRAEVHEEGSLPAVPRANGAREAIARENIVPDATETPSCDRFLELVFATEELFGCSSEKRKLWKVAALTAAVGSRARVADRDKLHALLQRGASATELSRYLESPTVGCFTAGGSNGLLILRPVKGGVQEFRASAQVLASVMGVPLVLDHPVRRGLDAVTPGQARAIMGQSMDMDVIERIFRAELPGLLSKRGHRSVPGEHSSAPTLSLADMFSGISMPAAAAMRLRPAATGAPRRRGPGQFRYKLACETVDTVLKAHCSAWGGIVEKVIQRAHSEEAMAAMAAAAPLDLAVAGVRCSPWAASKTKPDPADPGFKVCRERALEETCQAASALVAGAPQRIILETSEFLLRGKRRPYWKRLSAHLQSFEDYKWCYQVICPRKALAKWVPRARLFVVGRRVEDAA